MVVSVNISCNVWPSKQYPNFDRHSFVVVLKNDNANFTILRPF